ncbi:MAG TPA: hypothetical protein PK544_05560 [Spirochaetota bacterium]|nr:hypothetical protein [Spirochaetota bacterium]HPJ39082.1 hypothetical protein [Spirochaetota bacterium]HPQ52037.1 hypothetical protein [Spirochaetota bacterium]
MKLYVRKFVFLFILFYGVKAVYGEPVPAKNNHMKPPVFKLSADYYNFSGDSDRSESGNSGAGTSDEESGWDSEEFHINAESNIGISHHLRIKSKAYFNRAEYSASEFPSNLYDTGADVVVLNKDLMFTGGVRYAADTLEDTDERNAMVYRIMGGITFYQSGRHSWIGGMMYTTEKIFFNWGTFLPFISYKYLSQSLLIQAPMPILMIWRPVKKLKISVKSFLLLWNDVSIEYRVLPFLGIAMEYSRNGETYYDHNHADMDEKLIVDKQYAAVKVKVETGKYAGLYASCGYRFKNSYYYDTKVFNVNDDVEKIAIADYLMFNAGMELRCY